MPALTAVVAAAVLVATTLVGSVAPAAVPAKPNVVFVLVDDLAWNLVQYMPQVQRLQRDGTTFTNYTVTDSLCCPSRSSIFTGKSPHDTGVFTNNALEIATFAPHGPFMPARQDLDKFPGLTAPRTPAYDTLPANAPTRLAGNTALTADEKATLDTRFRKRAQAVQAVDRMIAALRQTLTDAGVAGNTYVVFSSDNGFHMGEHRLAYRG